MDPQSILTSTEGLRNSCAKLLCRLYMLERNVLLHDIIQKLETEVDWLSRILGTIQQNLCNPLLSSAVSDAVTGHEGVHWVSVKQTLHDCEGALKRLRQTLDNLDKGPGRFLGRKKNTRFTMGLEEAKLYISQVRCYRAALDLSSQLIFMYL